MSIDQTELRRKLCVYMQRDNISVRQISEKTGVSRKSIQRFVTGDPLTERLAAKIDAVAGEEDATIWPVIPDGRTGKHDLWMCRTALASQSLLKAIRRYHPEMVAE